MTELADTTSQQHGRDLPSVRFYEFGNLLLSARSIQETIELTVQSALEATSAHSVVIDLLDADGNQELSYGKDRQGQTIADEPGPQEQNTISKICAATQPLLVTGFEPDALIRIYPLIRPVGICAFIGLPLRGDASKPATGVLFVRYNTPHEFSDEEIRWLSLYAAQAVHMIEYVRLLKDYRQREADLAAVLDTTHMMTSTLDLRALLEHVAIRLAWVSSMDNCSISGLELDPVRLRTLAHYDTQGSPVDEDPEQEYLLSDYPETEKVIQTGEPDVIWVDDPIADPGEVALMKQWGYVTILMLPLRLADKPLGLIELYHRNMKRVFTTDEIRRLRLISEQVALALAKAHLYADEQRARLTAETLQRATAALNSTLELEQVLGMILQQLQQVVKYDSAALLLIEGDEFHVVAVHGHPYTQEALAVRKKIREDVLVLEMIRGRRAILIRDAQQDPRFLNLGHTQYVHGWMGIPLETRGEVIGMLGVDSRQPNAYHEEDARLAEIFASQAALAVTNARLYHSEREQHNLAEVLRDISLVLSSSLKRNAILDNLLEQIGRVVPYDSGCVMLVENGHVTIACHRGYEKFGVAQFVSQLEFDLENTPNLRLMMVSRQPTLISNVTNDPEWITWESTRHIGSWLGAPLVARDRLLGFLSLDKVEKNFYTQGYATTIEILAGHASLALLNALTFGEVEQASITDFVTGTYNHRYFQQQLRQEIDRAERMGYPLSLMMIDLDHFKLVNDTYGHLCGDQVLKQVAQRLKDELRAIDLLARYGGEEYMVILPGTPPKAMANVANRLLHAVSARPFQVEDHIIPLTISIGGVSYPTHTHEAQVLIALADEMMYTAKTAGRNCVRVAGADRK